jgi:large conductance mechanosensitive channel
VSDREAVSSGDEASDVARLPGEYRQRRVADLRSALGAEHERRRAVGFGDGEENLALAGLSSSAPGKIRTCDLSLRRRALYPLSYGRGRSRGYPLRLAKRGAMLKGFREFLLRGNIVDLAVAVVIGTAFGAVVTAFATDFIGGVIGAIGGSPDFGDAGPVNDAKIVYGSTVTALIDFVIVAGVIYFLVVVPMRELARLRGDAADVETPTPSDEAVLLTEIRDLLRGQERREGY